MLRQLILWTGVLLLTMAVTLLTPAASEAFFHKGYYSSYPTYYYGGYPAYSYGYPTYYYGGYRSYYYPGYTTYYSPTYSYSYRYVPYGYAYYP